MRVVGPLVLDANVVDSRDGEMAVSAVDLETCSVVYINFGGMAVMHLPHTTKVAFVWSGRDDLAAPGRVRGACHNGGGQQGQGRRVNTNRSSAWVVGSVEQDLIKATLPSSSSAR